MEPAPQDGEPAAAPPVAAVSTPALCQVCGQQEPKYRCPRCAVRTCSLACIKQHKKDAPCDGKRPASKFERVAEMTDLTIRRDYRLLEGSTRQKDANWRFLALPNKSLLNDHCMLQAACRSKRINLQLLPYVMQQRGWNSTALVDFGPARSHNARKHRFRGYEVVWMVELRLPTHPEELRLFAEGLRESMTVAEVLRCPRLFMSDDLASPKPSLPTEGGEPWEGQAPQARDTAALYVKQRRDLLISRPHHVLSKAVGVPGQTARYFELDPTWKLSEAMAKVALTIEWPVWCVVPEDQLEAYPLVDEDLRNQLENMMLNPLAFVPKPTEQPPDPAEGDEEEVAEDTPKPGAPAAGRGNNKAPCLNCGGPHPLHKCRRRIVCSYCHKEGHTRNICYANPEALSELCPRCGHRGHEVQDCSMYQPPHRRPKKEGADAMDRDAQCDNCGVWGHDFEDCSHPVQCVACGEDGHTYRQCTQHPTEDLKGAPKAFYGDQDDKLDALRFIVLPAKVKDLKRKTRASAVYVGRLDDEQQLQPSGEELEERDDVLTSGHRYLIQITEGPRICLCKNCGEIGHRVRDCPKEIRCANCHRLGHLKDVCRDKVYAEGEERPVRVCNNCGSKEHTLWECPEELVCTNCHRKGHTHHVCRSAAADEAGGKGAGKGGKGGGAGDGGGCRNCGAQDHYLRDCPKPTVCSQCHQSGHTHHVCPGAKVPPAVDHSPGSANHAASGLPPRTEAWEAGGATGGRGPGAGGGGGCRNCGAPDHFLRDCPHAVVCSHCRQPGHTHHVCPGAKPSPSAADHSAGWATNTTSGGPPPAWEAGDVGAGGQGPRVGGGGGGGGGGCRNCGAPDHFLRDCPHAVVCSHCRQPGHTHHVCPGAKPSPSATDHNAGWTTTAATGGPPPRTEAWEAGRAAGERGPGASGGSGGCRNCGAPDHFLRDCPHAVVCSHCRQLGHTHHVCPSQRQPPSSQLAVGGQSNALANGVRESGHGGGPQHGPERRDPMGAVHSSHGGHGDRERGGGGGGGGCRNCGAPDHFVRDCPRPMLCSHCHQPGHTHHVCPGPRPPPPYQPSAGGPPVGGGAPGPAHDYGPPGRHATPPSEAAPRHGLPPLKRSISDVASVDTVGLAPTKRQATRPTPPGPSFAPSQPPYSPSPGHGSQHSASTWPPRPPTPSPSSPAPTPLPSCLNCGGTGHSVQQCPSPLMCTACRQPGHSAATCPATAAAAGPRNWSGPPAPTHPGPRPPPPSGYRPAPPPAPVDYATAARWPSPPSAPGKGAGKGGAPGWGPPAPWPPR